MPIPPKCNRCVKARHLASNCSSNGKACLECGSLDPIVAKCPRKDGKFTTKMAVVANEKDKFNMDTFERAYIGGASGAC